MGIEESAPTIVNIESVPKSALAFLHLQYLPTAFSGTPGAKLLELYYEALSAEEQAIGLAAIINRKTVGFACAVSSVRQIQRQLFARSPFSVVWWAFAQVLWRPQILRGFIRRLMSRKVRTTGWPNQGDFAGWYTYRPIVVDECYRKFHVADLLTTSLLKEAEQRKVPGIISFVDSSNDRSSRHFVRNGFRELWSNEHFFVFGKKFEYT